MVLLSDGQISFLVLVFQGLFSFTGPSQALSPKVYYYFSPCPTSIDFCISFIPGVLGSVVRAPVSLGWDFPRSIITGTED